MLLLMNEMHEYNRKLEEIKMQIPKDLKKAIFRELFTRVAPNAIRIMVPQYEMVIQDRMKPYTETFTRQIGLPCSHKIQERMLEAGEVLRTKDIHTH